MEIVNDTASDHDWHLISEQPRDDNLTESVRCDIEFTPSLLSSEGADSQ